MAVIDVKRYYIQMVRQLTEMKADLADFEQAFRDGYITEDKLEDIKAELNQIQINCERLAFIMFLLEQPRRKSKKAKYNKANSDLVEAFDRLNADENSVIEENKSLLKQIREELLELTKK